MSATLLALASLIPTLAQTGIGVGQYFKGRKMGQEQRPTYQIPSAVNELVGRQRTAMTSDMPGQQAMIDQQRATSSNQMEQMAKYGMIDPNLASNVYGDERSMVGNIGLQGANYRSTEKDKYLSALGMLGQYQDYQQDMNVFDPYRRKMDAAGAMMGSGMQNIMGGLTGMADYTGTDAMMQTMGYDTPLGGLMNKGNTMGMSGQSGSLSPQDLYAIRNMSSRIGY